MNVFRKIIEWYKNHKVWVVIIVLTIFVFIPFITHTLFSIKAIFPFFTAKWTAGEILGYFTAILAAASSVLLGVIVVIQNDEMNKRQEERDLALLKREEDTRKAIEPDLRCLEIGYQLTRPPLKICGNIVVDLTISLQNLSLYPATKVKFYKVICDADGVKTEMKFDNPQNEINYENGKIYCVSKNSVYLLTDSSFSFELLYNDYKDYVYRKFYKITGFEERVGIHGKPALLESNCTIEEIS